MSECDTGAKNRPVAVAIETATLGGSVALGVEGRVVDACAMPGLRDHARGLLPTLKTLLEKHDVKPTAIGAVYVSAGPGSFTGLRIGLTAARMMAMATGAVAVPVPTLTAIAQNALAMDDPPLHVAVILDAKRGHVFGAAFVRKGDEYVALAEAAEVEPAAFLAEQPPHCVVLGEGIKPHAGTVRACGRAIGPVDLHAPRAERVLDLGYRLHQAGKAVAYRDLVPTYVRRPEAEEKWEQREVGK